jgi:hypothetical protein
MKVLFELVERSEVDPASACPSFYRAIRIHSDWPASIIALVDKLSLPVSRQSGLVSVFVRPLVRFAKPIEHDQLALFLCFVTAQRKR